VHRSQTGERAFAFDLDDHLVFIDVEVVTLDGGQGLFEG
jgi:hypothetical protein